MHNHVTQPWYAKNTGAVGTFEVLHDHMCDLLVRGPPRGYFQESTKIILVVYPRNVQDAEAHF